MKKQHLLSTTAALYVFSGIGAVAAAQDRPPSPASPVQSQVQSVEEVIVTATKREERLSDVPISITAASATQLAQRGIVKITDLPRIVPGLSYTLSSQGGPVYTLRGIGVNTDSVDVSPAVSVYVDQIPLPYSRMTEGASLDLARVEVLKGPQGTLFGQNSTGGAINYIAAKPTSDFQSGFDGTYGRYNEVAVGGFLSGPIGETLRARLAVRSERGDGWQHNYVPLPAGAPNTKNGVRDYLAARLLVDWDPNEDLKVEVNVNGWRDRSDMLAEQAVTYSALVPGGYPGSAMTPNLQAMLAAYPAATKATEAGFDPNVSLRRDDTAYQAAVRIDYSLTPDITLTSLSSFAHLEVFGPQDGDGTIYPDNRVTVQGSVKSFNQELRLAGSALDKRLRWMVGGNFEHDDTRNTFSVHIEGTNSGVGPLRVYDFNMLNDNKINTGALFASLNFDLTETLIFEGSVRGTYRHDAFTGCIKDPGDGMTSAAGSLLSTIATGTPQSIPPGVCTTLDDDFKPRGPVSLKLNEDNFSFRTGLSWKIRPSVMLYGNISKGYKGGAFETLPAFLASQFKPAPQESVLAYEAGFKSTLLDHKLTLNAAAFYYDYTDKQLQGAVQTQFGALNTLVSIPKARVKGAEVDASWKVDPYLALTFGGTVVDTKVTKDFTLNGAYLGPTNIKGEQFPNTPKWQLNGAVDYRHPLSSSLDVMLGGGVTYRSSAPAAFGGGPLFKLRSYTLLDLRAGVGASDGRWSLEAWGKNVTNVYYWNAVVHQEDIIGRMPAMPATYGVTYRTNF
jgi:outer membrane receptor protein involved in Fe transport